MFCKMIVTWDGFFENCSCLCKHNENSRFRIYKYLWSGA